MPRAHLKSFVCVALVLAPFAACSGSFPGGALDDGEPPGDDGPGGGNAAGAPGGRPGTGMGGQGADPVTDPPAACADMPGATLGRTRAVRLRWSEYQAVVRRALRKDVYTVSGSVPQDPVVEAYPNDGNALRVSTYAAARVYLDEAESALATVTDWPALLSAHGGCTSVDDACAGKALPKLAGALFRRPLSDDETTWVADRYRAFRAKVSAQEATRATTKLLLNHPAFLYRFEGVEPVHPGSALGVGPWEAASALSFTLTGGPPDDALWAAASSGELNTTAGVRAQIRRLVDDRSASARVPAMLAELAQSWLVSGPVAEKSLGIDKRVVDPAILPALLEEDLGRTFTTLVLEKSASFSDLLTSPTAVSSGKLARAYGYPTTGDGFSTFDGSKHHRVGLLASPAFLAARGSLSFGRAIYRGVFTLRRLLCFDPGDPIGIDVDQAVLDAKLPEDLPDRKKLEAVTGAAPCQACHQSINAIGVAMDEYDAAGRHFSVTGRAAPDARVTLPQALFGGGEVNGLDELAKSLSGNEVAGACFAGHVGRYVGQGELGESEMCRVQAALGGKPFGEVPVRDLVETTLLVLLTSPRR